MSTHTIRFGETVPLDAREFDPHPLDRKILGGVALIKTVHAEDIVKVVGRVDDIFEDFAEDTSSEFGACVAYSLGVPDAERSKIEDIITGAASRIIDGDMHRYEDVISGGSIWTGQYRDRPFYLSNRSIPIVLSDGTLPVGDVYTVVGTSSKQ